MAYSMLMEKEGEESMRLNPMALTAVFMAYFRPLCPDILCLICCPWYLRSKVVREVTQHEILPTEGISRHPLVPGNDKVFVFVSGGIQPCNVEEMNDYYLWLEPDMQVKTELRIRPNGNELFATVEFRTASTIVEGKLLCKLYLPRPLFSSSYGVQRIKYGFVVDEELELLSIQIKNWRPLARRLGFLEIEMVEFDKGNENVSETVLAMLIRWKQREGAGATYRVLHDALCHPIVNRQDLAYKFCIDASSSLLTGGNGKTTSVKNDLERRKIYEETVPVEGAHWNLKLGAIHLTFHPYAVSEPTQIVVHELKNSACLPPLLEHEAVVSNVIEISTINGKPLEFKRDVELFLSHSAPGLQGYELVIKRKDLYETKDDWIDVDDTEDLSNLQDVDDLPSSMEISKLLFPVARAHIAECSTYAVVCRLRSSPRYEITSKGGCFNHPDYPGVTLTFPKKAVEPKTNLSIALKVQEVPAEEFEGQNVFLGPIIRIMCNDFVQFLKPVTIQLPVCLRNKQEGISYTTTHHAKVLYMETDGNHKEWVDMTDRLLSPPRCDGMYVRFQVKHFSGFVVVWCREKFHGFIRKLSNLFWYQPIRAYFFAHYSPLSPLDDTKGTVCLTTCSAAERPGIIQELINTKKDEIYSEITSRQYVIPEHDKAFVFVSGRIQPACMKGIEDFSLQFDRNGPYKDEIRVYLIEDEMRDAVVRFHSGPEATPNTLLGRVTLKMPAAEARCTEPSHSSTLTTGRGLPGTSGEIKTGSPSDYELEGLSNKVLNWEALGRQLGFTDVQLVHFDRDNIGFTNKIYKMLLAWKQKEGSGATYEVLYNALCSEYVMYRKLAEIFCFTKRGIKRNSLGLDP